MYKYTIEESAFPKVSITYTNAHHNVKEVQRTFTCREDADRFVNIDMRNWMADNLRRYITHAAILSEVGHPAYYKVISRCQSLDHCLKMLPLLDTCPLFTISAWILDNEKQLQAILPAPKNTSYANSSMNLKELVWLSVQLRKQQKQIA